MWSSKDKSLTYDQLKAESSKAKKDLHIVSVTLRRNTDLKQFECDVT